MTSEAPVPTRVGGGVSVRAAVAIVAGGLAIIVGAAFVNRPPTPSPRVQAVVAPTASSNVAELSSPAATPAPLTTRTYKGVAFEDDAFAAIAMIGGRQFPLFLQDEHNGTLDGWTRFSYPRGGTKNTVQLAQLWTRAAQKNFQSIGTWPLPLDGLTPEVQESGTVLSVNSEAQLGGTNRLVRDGFQLDVRVESQADFGVIFVTVTTTPQLAVQHKLYGEDGIFGLPGWPWRADDTKSSAPAPTGAPTSPPKYVIKWLGRFWPGPGQKLTR